MFTKKLKVLVISLSMVFNGALLLSPVVVSAASTFAGDACNGVAAAGSDTNTDGTPSTTCSSTSGDTLSNIIKLVLNVLSIIVGVAAVIMMILGGLKYVTSSGDSSNTASARNTIIYAVVGLVVVAMAQIMVHFVIGSAINSKTTCKTTTDTGCTVNLCKTVGQTNCTVKK